MKPFLLIIAGISLGLIACDPESKPAPASDRNSDDPQISRHLRPVIPTQADRVEATRSALRVARQIALPAERDARIAEIAWEVIDQHLELAREAFESLPAGSEARLTLIQHYAMAIADDDPDRAIKWAATAGTDDEIAAAFGQIALVISDTDPERAAHILSESGIAGREFDVAVVQVLQRWAVKSPPAAAAWVCVFPGGDARKSGIQVVLAEWLDSDPVGASAWIQTLNGTPLREEAAQALEEIRRDKPQDDNAVSPP